MNGQYHGKKNRLGIRIKNPLPKAVLVDILDGKGYGTCRTLHPGGEVYVKVPHPGDYDVKTTILRYDETGQSHSLGETSWDEVTTVAPKSSPAPAAGPIILHQTSTLHNRRWKNIISWNIPFDCTGLLMAISIQITGDVEARVDLPNTLPQIAREDTTLAYKNSKPLKPGQTVRVKGRGKVGNGGTIEVMLQGQLTPDGTKIPTDKQPTEAKRRQPEQPPIRSLGELMDEMEKREKVTV